MSYQEKLFTQKHHYLCELLHNWWWSKRNTTGHSRGRKRKKHSPTHCVGTFARQSNCPIHLRETRGKKAEKPCSRQQRKRWLGCSSSGPKKKKSLQASANTCAAAAAQKSHEENARALQHPPPLFGDCQPPACHSPLKQGALSVYCGQAIVACPVLWEDRRWKPSGLKSSPSWPGARGSFRQLGYAVDLRARAEAAEDRLCRTKRSGWVPFRCWLVPSEFSSLASEQSNVGLAVSLRLDCRAGPGLGLAWPVLVRPASPYALLPPRISSRKIFLCAFAKSGRASCPHRALSLSLSLFFSLRAMNAEGPSRAVRSIGLRMARACLKSLQGHSLSESERRNLESAAFGFFLSDAPPPPLVPHTHPHECEGIRFSRAQLKGQAWNRGAPFAAEASSLQPCSHSRVVPEQRRAPCWRRKKSPAQGKEAQPMQIHTLLSHVGSSSAWKH